MQSKMLGYLSLLLQALSGFVLLLLLAYTCNILPKKGIPAFSYDFRQYGPPHLSAYDLNISPYQRRIDSGTQEYLEEVKNFCSGIMNVSVSYNTSIPICQRYQSERNLSRQVFLSPWTRNTSDISAEDITMVTQLTPDKFTVFEQLLQQWTGPVSAAVYLECSTFTKPVLKQIRRWAQRHKHLHIHFLIKKGQFHPINRLRNLALSQVRSKYVFVNDVDFVPVSGLYEELLRVLRHNTTTLNLKQVFVIPAFEMLFQINSFPKGKQQLIRYWMLRKIVPFHMHTFKPAHRPTEFHTWLESRNPYEIQWSQHFEPYIVGMTETLPYFNEQFLGRYFNKAAYIEDLHDLGYSFIVLPNVFLVHMPHAKVRYENHYECSLNTYKTNRKHKSRK